MAALTAAGVVFVPFDSGSFTEVANIAWDGGPESDDYMEPEAIARSATACNPADDAPQLLHDLTGPPILQNLSSTAILQEA